MILKLQKNLMFLATGVGVEKTNLKAWATTPSPRVPYWFQVLDPGWVRCEPPIPRAGCVSPMYLWTGRALPVV